MSDFPIFSKLLNTVLLTTLSPSSSSMAFSMSSKSKNLLITFPESSVISWKSFFSPLLISSKTSSSCLLLSSTISLPCTAIFSPCSKISFPLFVTLSAFALMLVGNIPFLAHIATPPIAAHKPIAAIKIVFLFAFILSIIPAFSALADLVDNSKVSCPVFGIDV